MKYPNAQKDLMSWEDPFTDEESSEEPTQWWLRLFAWLTPSIILATVLIALRSLPTSNPDLFLENCAILVTIGFGLLDARLRSTENDNGLSGLLGWVIVYCFCQFFLLMITLIFVALFILI